MYDYRKCLKTNNLMKGNLYKILTYIFLFSMLSNVCFCQNSNDEEKDYNLLIPRLEVLIESAMKKNGLLLSSKDQIEVQKEELNAIKRNWTKYIGFRAESWYGTFNYMLNYSSGNNLFFIPKSTDRANYNLGMYIDLPFYEILNRKSEIRQARAKISQAENMFKAQKDEINQMVISYYEDLKLKERQFQIQSVNLSYAKVNMEMAKKEFTSGNIEIYEYIRISDITSAVNIQFEQAKSDLILAKKLLEIIQA